MASRWQDAILGALQRDGRMRITALAEELAVSDETIRRHLRPLIADGFLRKTHGEVELERSASEPPFHRRLQEHAEAKKAIARAVVGLVAEGSAVMLDTGSTTAYVAEALASRRQLTVITNGVEVARAVVGRNGHRVYLAGGELRADLAAALGTEALHFLEPFRADLAILSIAAIDPEHGLMNFDLDEARMAQAMLARAGRSMVVADASKFTAKAPVHVADLGDIDLLVTDQAPGEPFAAQLQAGGVQLVLA